MNYLIIKIEPKNLLVYFIVNLLVSTLYIACKLHYFGVTTLIK